MEKLEDILKRDIEKAYSNSEFCDITVKYFNDVASCIKDPGAIIEASKAIIAYSPYPSVGETVARRLSHVAETRSSKIVRLTSKIYLNELVKETINAYSENPEIAWYIGRIGSHLSLYGDKNNFYKTFTSIVETLKAYSNKPELGKKIVSIIDIVNDRIGNAEVLMKVSEAIKAYSNVPEIGVFIADAIANISRKRVLKDKNKYLNLNKYFSKSEINENTAFVSEVFLDEEVKKKIAGLPYYIPYTVATIALNRLHRIHKDPKSQVPTTESIKAIRATLEVFEKARNYNLPIKYFIQKIENVAKVKNEEEVIEQCKNIIKNIKNGNYNFTRVYWKKKRYGLAMEC